MSTTVDTDTISHLDFNVEDEIICEVLTTNLETCAKKATWIIRLRCCPRSILMCSQHKVKMENFLANRAGPVHCHTCSKVYYTVDDYIWTRLDT